MVLPAAVTVSMTRKTSNSSLHYLATLLFLTLLISDTDAKSEFLHKPVMLLRAQHQSKERKGNRLEAKVLVNLAGTWLGSLQPEWRPVFFRLFNRGSQYRR
jgi:hypothetical protein